MTLNYTSNLFAEKEVPEPTRRETNVTLPAAELPKHQQRPSLISLFTGAGAQQQPSSHASSIQLDSRSGTLIGTPSDTLSQQALHPPRGESLSSSSTTTNKEPSDSHSGECPTPTQSMQQTGSSTIVAGGSSNASLSGNQPPFMSHSMSLQQQNWKIQQPRLRFVSSVEFRHSSGETSTTPLSPESPIDDSSSEAQRPSRLQRSKAQSRKTFRLRRGRQNHGDVSRNLMAEVYSVGRSFKRLFNLQTLSHSTDNSQEIPVPKPPLLTDVSWDSVSQTSSTSGYRDNYSFQTSLLSPDGSLSGTAPLARSSSQHSLIMLFEAQDEDTLI